MLIGIFDSLGAQTDRLRCEACQNLILSPMNTGLLRCAVATVLTVYGIETTLIRQGVQDEKVATVLTVYGIETLKDKTPLSRSNSMQVATVLTVYGIETRRYPHGFQP